MLTRCLAGSLLVAVLPVVVMAQATSHRIEVRGTGDVTVPADELTLPLEIHTWGKEFVTVKQRNDLLLKQLLELLSVHKLPQPPLESTFATFDFSERETGGKQQAYQKSNNIQNNNVRPGKGNDPFGEPAEARPPIQMRRRVTLHFERISQVTELLAKLTALDAVRVSQELRLSPLEARLKDSAPHQITARRLAVKRAKEQATLLAEASDLKLGAAIAIVDESSSASPQLFSPAGGYDPFGSNFPTVPTTSEQASPRTFVSFQDKKGETDPDLLPPAQLNIVISIKVIFEATPLK